MTAPHLLINLSFLLAQPTGLSIYAANVYPELKRLQPTLLTPETIADHDCVVVPDNLTPASGSRGHFNRLWWTQWQLPAIYQQQRGTLLFSPVPEAPLGSPCRFVVMVHDLIPLRFPRWQSPLTAYNRFYIPRVLEQAVHILCNSQATADDVINFFGIPAHKITPVPLGYDQQHFRPAAPDITPPERPYFLFIGRHDPHKNVARLIRAFAQFCTLVEPGQSPLPAVDLILAGPTDDRYTPQLMALAAELGVKARVHCLDYVDYDQLRQLYQQAIALVFPSLWEGFGFPVLEAMACGAPVITSNCSALPEVAGEAALLMDPTHVGDLAAAMTTVWQDPRLRTDLKQKGLQQAAQFSWSKTGQLTAAVLDAWM